MVRFFSLLILLCLLVVVARPSTPTLVAEETSTPTRRVNAPYNLPLNQSAVFWFGHVNSTSNFANVRVGYNDDRLQVFVHIFDRQIWYNPSATAADLTNWDAVSLFLNLGGNVGSTPTSSAYRLVTQFTPTNHQAAYKGTGSGWALVPLAFTTETNYRGEGFNNGAPTRGWWAKFEVPFTSLGLTGRPANGSIWGLSVTVHDRDDSAGTPIPDQKWPVAAINLRPDTWGQMRFGLPGYVPPPAKQIKTTTITHGVNGNSVVDAHVGGHSLCGSLAASWDEWGYTTHPGFHQINIQNQWDIADWPCYSKYYVTFPLKDIPANRVIVSAKLKMFQFGSAGQGLKPDPEPSYIQVFTIAEDWKETELTWNNAPLAVENWTGTWVNPLNPPTPWPGIIREWNVTGPAAEAYLAGKPLRLALFSADTAYHSGRYFYSSDAGAAARPYLEIVWGEPSPPVNYNWFNFVPTVKYK